jgi:hypothetical protein
MKRLLISQKKIILYGFFCLSTVVAIHAQTVVITDDSTYITGQSSAVLDLGSTTKGLLPPRVSAAQKTAIVSPAAGLLVYQTDELAGYYLWTGTRWDPLVSGLGGLTPVAKTATTTLLKTETFVLASNDILLTLPVVTSADNGLSICIKNIGSYTHQVQVKANGSATIDGVSSAFNHTRWQAKTYIAYNGNWMLKEKTIGYINEYEVSPYSSFTTLEEAIGFLAVHMTRPSVIRLGAGVHPISSTQTIDLPYPLTISGLSFGETTIAAAAGLAGAPMFSCASETYFKMLQFDATTLAGYGSAANEDAIWLTGSGNYHEVKDANFDGFNKAIVIKNNIELWLFESDINNCSATGVEIIAGAATGTIFKASETDFTNCVQGISLVSGINAVLSIINCGFYNVTSTDVCLHYEPATFSPYASLFVTGNTWNGVGFFLHGFDFTRSDGRDANCFIQDNAGEVDHNPACRISVINNGSTTTLSNNSNWYKANWTNTSTIASNWAISNNRMTFLSLNKRDAIVMITGNLSINNSNRTVSIALVKNGISTTQYGETTLRITTASQPFQFSTVIYLQNINRNDYFELFCRSSSNGDVLNLQDIQWLTESK